MSDSVLNQFTQTVAEEKKTSGRRFKVGIIGTGWIADAHMACYLRQPDIEIVAGADLIPGKAEAFFKKHQGHEHYKDWRCVK